MPEMQDDQASEMGATHIVAHESVLILARNSSRLNNELGTTNNLNEFLAQIARDPVEVLNRLQSTGASEGRPIVLLYTPPSWAVVLEMFKATEAGLPIDECQLTNSLNRWFECHELLLKCASRSSNFKLISASALGSISNERLMNLLGGDLAVEYQGVISDTMRVSLRLADRVVDARIRERVLFGEIESLSEVEAPDVGDGGHEDAFQDIQAYVADLTLNAQRERLLSEEVDQLKTLVRTLNIQLEAAKSSLGKASIELKTIEANSTESLVRERRKGEEALRANEQMKQELAAKCREIESLRIYEKNAKQEIERTHRDHREALAEIEKASRDKAKLKELLEQNEKQRKLDATISANSKASIEKLQLRVKTTEAETSRLVAELGEARLVAQNSRKENGLLGKQLDVLRNELNRFHMVAMDAERQLEMQSTTNAAHLRFWRDNHPNLMQLDLSGYMALSGWHAGDGEGRWSGPECTSNITVPAPRTGIYNVCLDVVGAIKQTLLEQMQVHLNGRAMEIDLRGVMAPCLVSFVVDTREWSFSEAENDLWCLSITLTETICPQTLGIPDGRSIGICVSSLYIERLDRDDE